ncbi:MAG TPA: IS110 family transposase [Terriglobales bacterium]|nr:IS110 family transposase [Terriglobales bacterium]
MAKQSHRRCDQLPVLHPDAAGIDVGASELFVAVGADRDPQPVRRFPTFTRDLHALADWLQQCGVRSVAMESTSVYWIPIYQILEARGLDVCLVNAQHVKNVPGRKTDVSDCQWLQYLHSVGLLRASFRPPGTICAVRALWRHRGSLIQMAAEHIMHIQKALDQMNLQVHRVLTEITGLSGLRILDAILAGERDPLTLARLCHSRVKSSESTVAKSLEGDYRPEHVFALRQSLAAYRYYQQLVLETDREIQRQMAELEAADIALAEMPKRTKRLPYQRQGHEPRVFDLHRELYRVFGVDLTNVPGISSMTAQTILCEVGTDVSRFRNASAFASWLGLCPEKKVSGGKVLFTKSRRVRSRVAIALRLAARSLHHAKDYMGEFFRRICRKLGKPQAITATAHKLARIVYHLLAQESRTTSPSSTNAKRWRSSVPRCDCASRLHISDFESSRQRQNDCSLGACNWLRPDSVTRNVGLRDDALALSRAAATARADIGASRARFWEQGSGACVQIIDDVRPSRRSRLRVCHIHRVPGPPSLTHRRGVYPDPDWFLTSRPADRIPSGAPFTRAHPVPGRCDR